MKGFPENLESLPYFALIIIPIVLLVVWMVTGIILRMSCSLLNSVAGGTYAEGATPIPSLGWAMVIQFIVLVASIVINFGVQFLMGVMFVSMRGQAQQMQAFAGLIALAVQFLVQSILYAVLLPTGIFRSLFITVIYYVIFFVLAVVFGILAAIVMMVLGAGLAQNFKL